MSNTFFEQVVRVQAGETIGPLNLSYSDFPRSAGWSLKCVIIGQTGLDADVAAEAGSFPDNFILTIPSTVTTVWKSGRKAFAIEAVHATNGTQIAERGALNVLPNPRVTTAEMAILANIRAVKGGLATDGQRTIALDGVQLQHMTPQQLDSWEARYIKVVNAQIGAAGGNGGVYTIQMRTPQDNRYAAPWFAPAGSSR